MSDLWTQTLLDPERPCPPGLTTWNGSDPAQRFAVYRNTVMVSLIDALTDTFPVVEQLVGRDFFRAMARGYIRAHPPHTPQLVQFGRAFPAFIAEFPPSWSIPYLPDLARLELAYVDAFHAADALPMSEETWQRLLSSPESLTDVQFQFQPSLHVLRSDYAIVSLWTAHQADTGQALDSIDPEVPENAWVIRRDWQVGVRHGTDSDTALLQALLAGQPLGPAVAEILSQDPGFDVAACLGQFLIEQLMTGVIA